MVFLLIFLVAHTLQGYDHSLRDAPLYGRDRPADIIQDYHRGEFTSFLYSMEQKSSLLQSKIPQKPTKALDREELGLAQSFLPKEKRESFRTKLQGLLTERNQKLEKLCSNKQELSISAAIASLAQEPHYTKSEKLATAYLNGLSLRAKETLSAIEQLFLSEKEREELLQRTVDEIIKKSTIPTYRAMTQKMVLKVDLFSRILKIAEETSSDDPSCEKIVCAAGAFLKHCYYLLDLNYLIALERGEVAPLNETEERAKEIFVSYRRRLDEL